MINTLLADFQAATLRPTQGGRFIGNVLIAEHPVVGWSGALDPITNKNQYSQIDTDLNAMDALSEGSMAADGRTIYGSVENYKTRKDEIAQGDLVTGSVLKKWTVIDSIWMGTLVPGTQRYVYGGSNAAGREIGIFDAATGKKVWQLPVEADVCAANGKVVLVAANDQLALLSVTDGKQVAFTAVLTKCPVVVGGFALTEGVSDDGQDRLLVTRVM